MTEGEPGDKATRRHGDAVPLGSVDVGDCPVSRLYLTIRAWKNQPRVLLRVRMAGRLYLQRSPLYILSRTVSCSET